MPAQDPSNFKDPTFSPLRDNTGTFKKVPEPPTQVKKDQNDPNWDRLNPDVIALCQRNGMARSALELYLRGELNWMEALETMVVALGKELLANQEILVEAREEYVSVYNRNKQLENNSQPASFMELDGEQAHNQFFALNPPKG